MVVLVIVVILDEDLIMCSYYFCEVKISEKGFFILFFVVNYLVLLVIIFVLYGVIICKLWFYKVFSIEEG